MASWISRWVKAGPAPQPPTPEPVPDSVLALPATGPAVPEGFDVLVIPPVGLATWAAAADLGKRPPQQGERRWWVRRAPWWVEFAPQAEAPRAGLRCRLVRQTHTVQDNSLTLATFLSGCTGPVESAFLGRHLMSLMRQTGHKSLVRRLPPCAEADTLRVLQVDLSSQTRLVLGREAEGLQRVLLSWPSAPGHEAADAAAVPEASLQAGFAPASLSPDVPWDQVIAEDRRACARLAEGLPGLCAQWRRLLEGRAPTDPAQLRRLYALADACDRLRSDWVPSDLATQQSVSPACDAVLGRTMSLLALRSERSLLQLQLALNRHAAGPKGVDAAALQALEALMNSLDIDARRRLNGWWKELQA